MSRCERAFEIVFDGRSAAGPLAGSSLHQPSYTLRLTDLRSERALHLRAYGGVGAVLTGQLPGSSWVEFVGELFDELHGIGSW